MVLTQLNGRRQMIAKPTDKLKVPAAEPSTLIVTRSAASVYPDLTERPVVAHVLNLSPA
jgi:hypothetical protein